MALASDLTLLPAQQCDDGRRGRIHQRRSEELLAGTNPWKLWKLCASWMILQKSIVNHQKGKGGVSKVSHCCFASLLNIKLQAHNVQWFWNLELPWKRRVEVIRTGHRASGLPKYCHLRFSSNVFTQRLCNEEVILTFCTCWLFNNLVPLYSTSSAVL